MTKKEFKERLSYHRYTGRPKVVNINAIFFDWKEGEDFRGYKYCIYSRAINATKAQLEAMLYDFIHGKIEDVEWNIQLVVADTDQERFKVPIMGSGLRSLIKYK